MPPTDPISSSSRKVQPFLAMEILERAQAMEREGVDVIHLEVGEPDFNVPACVDEAVSRALAGGETHYTHSLGVHELREEIASYYASRYGVTVDPERVVVTAGTSGAMVLLMALLLDAGDEVLLPNPCYACYDNFVRSFHGEPVFFDVRAEDGFRYDPERAREKLSARTKALFVNSPSNPTAAIQDRETLSRLVELGVPIVSDEIYHALEYAENGTRATSVLELTDEAFVIDGFSKRYAMTGLRVGWLVAPARFVDTIQRLQQNLFVCASSIAQHGGIAALRHAWNDVESMLGEYRRRRRVLLEGVQRLGFPVPSEPMGAYYVLVDATRLGSDSLALARRILDEAHVGVTPGIDFGSNAEGCLRFSFANSVENIEEGLRRLERWMSATIA
jgi:aspartate/methionine/tyrosine aminotransferase